MSIFWVIIIIKEELMSRFRGFFSNILQRFCLTIFYYILPSSTFVCPTEIIAFSDRVSEFNKINTDVVAVSVDSQFTHLAWYVCSYTTPNGVYLLYLDLGLFPPTRILIIIVITSSYIAHFTKTVSMCFNYISALVIGQ